MLDCWLFFASLSRILDVVCKLDIRFESHRNEFQYRQFIHTQPFRNAGLVCLGYAVQQLFFLSLCLIAESRRTDGNAFRGQADTRLAYFLVQGFVILLLFFTSVTRLLRPFIRRFRTFNWEPLWTFVISSIIVSHVLFGHRELALLAGYAPDDVWIDAPLNTGLVVILLPIVVVALASQLLPMRCCYLGPLAAMAAIASIAHVIVFHRESLASMGSDAETGNVVSVVLRDAALVLALFVVMYSSAQQGEKDSREKWMLASKERQQLEAHVGRDRVKAELVRDLGLLRRAQCYFVIPLREDIRIYGARKRAFDFFGKEVDGQVFTELLQPPDRDRFTGFLKGIEGSRMPSRIKVTMCRGTGLTPQKICIFAIYNGRPGRHFLIGIRSAESPHAASAPSQHPRPSDSLQDSPKRDKKMGSSERQIFSSVIVPDSSDPALLLSSLASPDQDLHPFTVPEEEDMISQEAPALSYGRQVSPGEGSENESDGSQKAGEKTLNQSEHSQFSGFSGNDVHRTLSTASLDYTVVSSEGADSMEVISFFRGHEIQTQTDPLMGMRHASVETNVTWANAQFNCTCCVRPPLPLADRQRAMAAAANVPSRKRRHKPKSKPKECQSSTLSELGGNWVIMNQFIGITQAFLHRLMIVGDRCIDAAGQGWKLHQEGSNIYLIKGRIWIEGGDLYREGKSGMVVSFQRMENQEDSLDAALDSDNPMEMVPAESAPIMSESSCESTVGEEVDSSLSPVDNLAVLERILLESQGRADSAAAGAWGEGDQA